MTAINLITLLMLAVATAGIYQSVKEIIHDYCNRNKYKF